MALKDPEDSTLDAMMPSKIGETCDDCVHLFNNQVTCKAFPDGIPDAILVDDTVHDKKMFDQKNDFVFTPKK